MNKRIKELAKRCYETGPIGRDGWPEYTKFNETKFAELIVKECADIANRQFESATGLNDRDCLTAAEMKKHFGVEE